MPGAAVWVTVGSGRWNIQATLPAFTAWSMGTGDVCVIVGWGMVKGPSYVSRV